MPTSCSGPEAAHLNITGVSGLATKTSAVSFLLIVALPDLPARAKGSVAAICFNVKGPDLCFLDQPAPLGEEDLALYDRLGLHPTPFANVTRVRALQGRRREPQHAAQQPRDHRSASQPLVWGLREVLDYAEVLLNRDDVDAKAEAFIDFLAERVVAKRFEAAELRSAPFEVLTFADLEEFFRAIFDFLEMRAKRERGLAHPSRCHHPQGAQPPRQHRHPLQGAGDRRRPANDLPWGAFRDRSRDVVDVAGVDPLAQDLVFARVISQAARAPRAPRPRRGPCGRVR